jgi:hypothetical protein
MWLYKDVDPELLFIRLSLGSSRSWSSDLYAPVAPGIRIWFSYRFLFNKKGAPLCICFRGNGSKGSCSFYLGVIHTYL